MAEFSHVDVTIDDDEIIDYIKKNYYPEKVFDEDELETWARENGFFKENE